ncbi:MAG: hypothetical protein AAFQ16_04995 [Pseudomonadota bacterium]
MEAKTGFDRRLDEIEEIHQEYSFLYQLLGGLFLLGIGILIGWMLFADKEGYIANLFTESLGILITVFVVNQLARRLTEVQGKKNRVYELHQLYWVELVRARRFASNTLRELSNDEFSENYFHMVYEWGSSNDHNDIEKYSAVSTLLHFYHLMAKEYKDKKLDKEELIKREFMGFWFYYPHFIKGLIESTSNHEVSSEKDTRKKESLMRFLSVIRQFAEELEKDTSVKTEIYDKTDVVRKIFEE